MIQTWDDLRFWQSGEWQVIQEKLSEYPKLRGDTRTDMNPDREFLFAALDLVDFKSVKVMIVGQDPYPDHKLATGVAFSIPWGVQPWDFPPTLRTILQEYRDDLGYPNPENGNLEVWSEREGVLLWNAIPSCEAGKSLSHNWPEWRLLTEEIIQELNQKGVVFVFLGGVARSFAGVVRDQTEDTLDPFTAWPNPGGQPASRGIVVEDREQSSTTLEFSHPSPRASWAAKNPFLGSRMFSTINDRLKNVHGMKPVNWRLL